MSYRRTSPRSLWIAGLALLLVVLAACSSPAPATDPAPAPATSVKLTADVPDGLTIGVVLSVASTPSQGAQWREAAQGAQVAASRYAAGGTTITLVPVNDKGTADGAKAAIDTLAEQGVAGIVVATSGSHLRDALQHAASLNLATLMPYETSAEGLPEHSWLTGPDAQIGDQRLVEALQQQNLHRPYLIDAGGGDIEGLAPVDSRTFAAGDDPDRLARRLAKVQRTGQSSFDAVVISGPAELQGRLVAALQGAGIETPMLLTSDALSPAFPAAVAKAGGSLSGVFVTAGLDVGDAAALQSGEAGRAATAYFSAVSLLAADPKATDLLGQVPFSSVAGAADSRSHDAVVALVRAAAAAKSTEPAAVAAALAEVKVGAPEGLAGPALDFSGPVTVAPEAVRVLSATPDSPGVRPVSPKVPSLYWYPTT